MSKKKKYVNIVIDGTEYKMIEEENKKEKHWMSIPKVEDGVPASGLHTFEKSKNQAHFDKFVGNKKLLDKKEYISPPPIPKMVVVNLKKGGIFPIPPENSIGVLRGSDKPMEFISPEYYDKNKERYLNKYFVRMGDENNPQILELKPKRIL